MPLEAALTALMQETVTLEPAQGLDKYGKFLYGTPVQVKAYIYRMAIRTINTEGIELVSEVQAILADPTLVVTVDDRLTLPNGTQLPIREVLSAWDDTGPYYLEVRA